MALCPNCGRELNPGAAYCRYCGAKAAPSAFPAPIEPPVAVAEQPQPNPAMEQPVPVAAAAQPTSAGVPKKNPANRQLGALLQRLLPDRQKRPWQLAAGGAALLCLIFIILCLTVIPGKIQAVNDGPGPVIDEWTEEEPELFSPDDNPDGRPLWPEHPIGEWYSDQKG